MYWHSKTLLLCGRKRRRYVFETSQMLLNICLRVLDRNGPLLIPPVVLRHHAAIDHTEPVLSPEIDINRDPVALIANFLWADHQSAIGTRLLDVPLQPGFRDNFAITSDEHFAQLLDMRIVFPCQNVAERG